VIGAVCQRATPSRRHVAPVDVLEAEFQNVPGRHGILPEDPDVLQFRERLDAVVEHANPRG
jgi:hypothetical protein